MFKSYMSTSHVLAFSDLSFTCARCFGVSKQWWSDGENESHELMLAITAKAVEAEHPVAHPQSPCQFPMLSNTLSQWCFCIFFFPSFIGGKE